MWQYSNNYIQPKQEESIKKKREEERERDDFNSEGGEVEFEC